MNPEDYISSFSFDKRLAIYDIQGSLAHVRMLAAKKIIPAKDAKKIIAGLKSIAADLVKGRSIPPGEDIHFAVETELVKRIGEVGKKMHTARSRNDQVALDLKLYVRDAAEDAVEKITAAQQAILACAEKNRDVLMPGFTHLQHGQPIFFAHHILAYAWMLERDKSRFIDCFHRLNESPLGACALAGTSFPIDRAMTAKELGFFGPTENSIDSVADRDFIAEFISDCSITMVHLSRMAEDLIIWSSSEFGYVSLAENLTSGSSIMPQKRNPDTAELLRGKTGKVLGNLVQILSILKNQPLAYNRDLQEDKPPLFDAAETTLVSLELAAHFFPGMKVNGARMEGSCKKGFLLATELADYLARKGMPFRAAHAVVKKIVHSLRDSSGEEYRGLDDLKLKELKKFSPLFEEDAFLVLDPRKVAEARNSYGGTGKSALAKQISKLKSLLKQ